MEALNRAQQANLLRDTAKKLRIPQEEVIKMSVKSDGIWAYHDAERFLYYWEEHGVLHPDVVSFCKEKLKEV